MTTGLAALLGVVQGITEFLPISSKTHLVVVPALLGEKPPSLEFIVLLHLGTLIALLAYFVRDLWSIAVDVVRGGDGRRLLGLLVIGSIPAAILGLAFEETFEELLSHPRGVAFALLATAAILLGAEWLAGAFHLGGGSKRLPRPLRSEPNTRDAIGIGLAQAVALLPGVSRSGSTLSAGLVLGLRRETAARFSFLLAIPALVGANVLELPKVVDTGIGRPEVVGFAASLVTGFFAVWILMRYLKRWNYIPFAIYCAVFALVAGLLLGD